MDRLALASHELLAAALRSPGAAPTGLRRLVTGSAARGLCVLATGVALVASTPLALGAKRSTATRSAAKASSARAPGARPRDPTRDALPPPGPRFRPPDQGVLFADDFSHGLGAWTPDRDSVWSIRAGMLRGDLPDGPQQRAFLYAGSQHWADYAVDLDVCGIRGVDKGIAVRVQGESGVGVDLRGPGYHDVLLYQGKIPLGQHRIDNGNGMWHHLRVEARGPRYRVWVNGTLVLDRKDRRNAHPEGRIALAAYTGGVGQCTLYFDNVVVTSPR